MWISLPRSRKARSWQWFRPDRRGAVAVMFAICVLPLIMIIAFATDYGFYIQAQSQLNLAADAAALHATRVASNRYQNGGTLADAEAMGQTAAMQWFTAQAGRLGAATISSVSATVGYAPQPGGFTATVTYSGTVATGLGSFIVPSWNISNVAVASNQNAYVEILMMLDNSSSMQIGASPSDMLTLMQITPCAPFNAIPTPTGGSFSGYQCRVGGVTYDGPSYDGSPACPISVPALGDSPLSPTGSLWVNTAPSCQGILPLQTSGPGAGTYLYASAPCAFACHSDNTKPAGSGNDNYALARGTIGTAHPVTLRFDVVKNAVNTMFATINTKNAGSSVSVGVYTFNSKLTQIYPASGEAGTDLTTAQGKVGAPPTTPYGADTGIQPEVLVGDLIHSNTYFNESMATLATKVAASGDGSTAAQPQKFLIIVTDGMQNSALPGQAIDPTQCTKFQNMGYVVYVLDIPYRPLMNYSYLAPPGLPTTVETTGPGSLSYALQQCASPSTTTPNPNYIIASDSAGINTALNTFLNNALNSSSRLTR